MILLFFKLMIGHAVADFALQSDTMARGKNPKWRPKELPPGQKYTPCWPYWLTAHALIHAGAVWLITGNPLFAVGELIHHWSLDWYKCVCGNSPHIDQICHILFKIVIVIVYTGVK